MGIDFPNTKMGHEFILRTMPRLAKATERIADSLSVIAEAKAAEPAWIVVIANHGDGEISAYRTNGTEEKVREHLFRLISQKREEAGKNWNYGTEIPSDLDFDGVRLYGYANIATKKGIDSYMIDYVACRDAYQEI